MKIEIVDMDHLGRGIGKIDGKVVFVPKAIPGDVCEIKIVKECKNYNVGRIEKIIKSSNKRIEAICPYYDSCGGCNLLSLSYQEQLLFKENKVKNVFKKYLNMDIDVTVISSKKQEGYRNKITYHNDLGLGLISEDNQVIDIDECMLVSKKINELFKLIKKENIDNVNKITIRELDNGLVLDIAGDMDISRIKDKCIQIYIDGKKVYYKEGGYIKFGGKKFIVSNKSFFQINTSNIEVLYNEIKNIGKFNHNMRLVDLYCGVGSIGLFLADDVKSVLGIEIVPDGIKDAIHNAEINKIDNAKFICGDVGKIIDEVIDGDVLVVDPPRIGMDNYTSKVINNSKIKEVIYVSCDVMTLVRDLNRLSNYSIKEIRIVDMFPNTHHCESVCLLERR